MSKPLFQVGDRVRHTRFRIQGEVQAVGRGSRGFWYQVRFDDGRTPEIHEDRLQLLGLLESLALVADE